MAERVFIEILAHPEGVYVRIEEKGCIMSPTSARAVAEWLITAADRVDASGGPSPEVAASEDIRDGVVRS